MAIQASVEDAADLRICEATGLALVPTTGNPGTRIQKVSYGAMSPLKRPVKGEEPGHWGRYDVAGHSTIYIASTAEGAYTETLASQRISNTLKKVHLSDVFNDSDSSDSPDMVFDAIKHEWQHLFGGMTPGKIVLGWRDARLEYPMTLPESGWAIDIEKSASLAVINDNMRSTLGDLGIDHLTIGDLCGENRSITTAVARWLHARVLDDGSLPHGIVYGSKYGTDHMCWAIWLRNIDDGKHLDSEPTKADEGKPIALPRHNPPLAVVASRYGLTIY
jgi:RES domain